MNSVIVELSISHQDYLAYYHYPQAVIHATSIDGRRVQFPAGIMRQFVRHHGIRGRFCIYFDQQGRYQRIEQLTVWRPWILRLFHPPVESAMLAAHCHWPCRFMYRVLRFFLFLLPAEFAHTLTLCSLQCLYRLRLVGLFAARPMAAPRKVMGVDFPGPIGLAAGLDKNGDYIDGLAALGFDFIEIGTVTPRPQPGNPRPRLFRLPQSEAIINRMGFNNKGVDYLVSRVKKSNYRGVLGINIGKNKDTPAEKAVDDYLFCMERVYPYASYITINLSSPNTPGLRDLQFGDPLRQLLRRLKQSQSELCKQHQRYVPLAVKIAPDMAEEDVKNVASVLRELQIDGVIATNTTIERPGLEGQKFATEAGGLSGAPLKPAANATLEALSGYLAGQLPVIGVGGIVCGADAPEKVAAGASLLQVYTGFIYRGPALLTAMRRALQEQP